jgi:acetylornithine/succinyldiaminopimelate/putrescine aminotransferase
VKPSSTRENIACEPVRPPRDPLAETCARIIQGRVPNFFRLYLNPYVVQTCLCLSRYVQTTWPGPAEGETLYPSFLANSFDEALSGAIKLARYSGNQVRRPPAGLVIDPAGRLGPFAAVPLVGGGKVELIPKLVVIGDAPADLAAVCRSGERFGFVVLVGTPGPSWQGAAEALLQLVREQMPLVIVCVDREGLNACRCDPAALARALTPDVVVFDESFVDHQVPFAAFTATPALYGQWMKPGRSTFHSTTFQPNTISSLHFLRCLRVADPEFYATVAVELGWIERDPNHCAALLGALYSPSLRRAITALGFATPHTWAAGHYVETAGRRIFDGVAGVASSIRGHNPETYLEEIADVGDLPDGLEPLAARLQELTGLEHVLPAVSGAGAVENALRLGLVAQFPRRYVLAFRGGFGGKTLLALTGTANASYKEHLDPLYEHVVYLDPFAPTVLDDLEAALRQYPVAVVQLELIQAVGGVRPVPAPVLHYLEAEKRRWGYLLFVDEVQTGMYRTGPFTRSEQAGIRPDLLTIGKGTSDMMFPFALTLYSAAVRQRLDAAQPALPAALLHRYAYDTGCRTVLNTLARAANADLAGKVAEAGALFARLLADRLRSCKAVRDVRVHGLLIAIELDRSGWPRRWLGKRLPALYLLGMLRHKVFPLLLGFCQYEPHVLKLTPPLSITPEETVRVCDTIADVLNRPTYRLLAAAVGAVVGSYFRRKPKREATDL